ncbi:DUF3040 domain-containing protein [Streptomyces sp. FH025]|uniref:DUF3040 domain-containing protein n=1 Tax=Streptomyces sp. FH025 TaxID=2815937 RepID=UPI001A9F2C92|nr:DUF3040 domain-containing protein [Streptomyces sp. FH025]MBO1419429.1 DUF3040 domain-containing protein [Streptomyces sp. FH025]
MDGPALSGWERRLLEEIESDLRQDARLDRKLSTMGAKPPSRARRALRSVGRRITAGVVLTALVMTAFCLSIGARTPTTAVLTALGVVWAASVAAAVAASELLRRRSARRADLPDGAERPDHREGRERRPWDQPEA